MKKLVASLAVAAALVVPAAPALADVPPPAGTDPCPSGFTGAIVWHWDPVDKEYDYYFLCFH